MATTSNGRSGGPNRSEEEHMTNKQPGRKVIALTQDDAELLMRVRVLIAGRDGKISSALATVREALTALETSLSEKASK